MSKPDIKINVSRKQIGPARLATIIIVLIGIALVSSAGFYTDVLWFDQLGYSSVFFTQIWAKLAMFGVAALIMGGMVGISIWLAYRSRPIYAKFSDERDPMAQLRQIFTSLRKAIMIFTPIILGVFAGLTAVSKWDETLLFLNAVPSGTTDAQFGLDVSFYLFTLPFLHSAVGFLATVLFFSAASAALVHLAIGGLRFNGKTGTSSTAARVQVAITAALFMVTEGVSLWLDQYSTMTSPSGLYTGATFADVNASIPGLQIMAVIAGIVALLFVFTAAVGRWRLPILGTGLMIVSSIILGGLYPWLVQ